MKRICSVLFLLTLVSLSANAQSIKGKLIDLIDNSPLPGATVQLSKLKDSTVTFNTVSDGKGLFRFNNLSADSFLLKISFVGYAEYRQFVTLTDSIDNVNLG